MNYSQFPIDNVDDEDAQMLAPSPDLDVAPEPNANVPRRPLVNILDGPGYKIYSTKKRVK